MKVYKCFLNIEKEEKWLADMAKKGYRLTRAGNCDYTFDYNNQLEDITYKIDYRNFNKESDYRDYCAMFEDSGWLHIGGSKWSGSQYFVKMRPDAGDDIFSDRLSRAGRYKRMSYMWLSIATPFIPLMIIFWQNGAVHLNLKSYYLTPGLWDMKGLHFVTAFLFETPFALLRSCSGLFFLIIILMYFFCSLKSYFMYKKELNN